MKRKICIVTGTRAEYGLLYGIMKKIDTNENLILQTIVTGMHLSQEFGLTYKEIEKDGFNINQKIEILMSSDTDIGICKAMGLANISFAETFKNLNPDLVVLLGDRFEIFAAATSAFVCRIPIVHIHGGEVTEGAIDDIFRHSITKMSSLHFTTTETYRRRVIQLGEKPDTVFNVGSLGVENIHKLDLLTIKKLEKKINFVFGKKTVLVTYHPETLGPSVSGKNFDNLLKAIDSFDDLKIIFTKSNADPGGRIINKMIDGYVSRENHKAISFISMGQINYLSAMKHVNAVVGNSSSGIIEAPSLKTPTVNIGDRQRGRVYAESVLHCDPKIISIKRALATVLSNKFAANIENVLNPYDQENTSDRIVKILLKQKIGQTVKKEFYDLPFKTDR